MIAPDIWPVLTSSQSLTSVGGAEVQQSILARRFRDAGFTTTILTKVPDGKLTDEYDGLRIIDISRRAREIPILRNVHPRLTQVWNALKLADADINYSRCAGANVLVAGMFSKKHRRPFVYSVAHDFDLEKDQTWRIFRGRGGWRDRQLYYRGLQLADVIVAQHSGQVDACRRWYARTAVEIPNCYEPPVFAKAKPDGVILWAASIKSMKRPELFVALARSLPNLRFRMIGGPAPCDASYFDRIRQEAATVLNLEFVGGVPLSEAERHFDRARIFVNTSMSEGFPNTFLQSWSRGIPTVSFIDCRAREGGRPVGEICRDLATMQERVAQLAYDDSRWSEAGERARVYFEAHHSVQIAVDRYLQLFRQVLSSS